MDLNTLAVCITVVLVSMIAGFTAVTAVVCWHDATRPRTIGEIFNLKAKEGDDDGSVPDVR